VGLFLNAIYSMKTNKNILLSKNSSTLSTTCIVADTSSVLKHKCLLFMVEIEESATESGDVPSNPLL
jgi:hypothetical protein